MGIADGDLTSIALCWLLERADGAGIGLTSHDQPLLRDDASFEPAPGIMPASITRKLGLEAGAGEITSALSSEALNDEDLALGRWNGAGVQLTAVDWTDPEANSIQLLGGEIGSVSIDGNSFTADLQGAAVKLDNPVCPATSAECRAQFGDKQCRIDLAGRTIGATVIESNAGALTFDEPIDERYILGRLRYMSGANCGLTSIVLSVSPTGVQLRDLPRAPVEIGCRVQLREGCDKRFATCVSRFANGANFRGEPHLPGNDLLTRYPGA